MSIKQWLDRIADTGVKKHYQPWEAHLTRKLNLSSVLGIFNVIACLAVFLSLGYRHSLFECSMVLLMAPFMFVLNRRHSYVPALYLFAFIGCFLFFFLSVKMGVEAFAFLYYFPLIIGIIQMAGRKELYLHLSLLVGLCILSIAAIVISYKLSLFEVRLPAHLVPTAKYINIFVSFFISIIFMFIISTESIRQETQLQSALQQKEVLLAELFHRVKNNLNLVTSLLNLKKESTTSEEARRALEECRNMVFSMALVHNRLYNNHNIDQLNFSEYLQELVPELIHAIGGREQVEFDMNSLPMSLTLAQAIPCGLIVNELVTNAFKHARVPGRKLKIHVSLKQQGAIVRIEVGDNGPGLQKNGQSHSSLGMELIKSLTGQLDGVHSFRNQEGLRFHLEFRQ